MWHVSVEYGKKEYSFIKKMILKQKHTNKKISICIVETSE